MAWYSIITNAYAINETIDTSMFAKRSSGSNLTYFIWFAVIVAVLLGLSFFYNYFNNRRMKKFGSRAFGGFESEREPEFNISEDTSERIEELAKAANIESDELLTNNKVFEKAIEKLRKKSPSNPLLLRIPSLREDLGYTFENKRNQFICTQMLPSGQKLRVAIKYKNKNHSYVGTILNTNEMEFWVTPPTVKGKTVDLSNFKAFGFSIFRKNDGEYRFRAKLKSQISKPQNALVMLHVNKIKKLHIREDDRFKMGFDRTFYFMIADDKRKDLSEEDEGLQCTGKVVDISTGGLKFEVEELPETVAVGANVMFRLEEAKIARDIQAEIVKITTEENDQSNVHIQFLNLSELNRLYLQKFIASENPNKIK